MALNSIGSFTFWQMSGPPKGAAQRSEIVSRAGIDGVAIWQTGRRGRPFTVQTLVFATSFELADTLAASYEAIQNVGTHNVFWASTPLRVQVVVLSVDVQVGRRAVQAVGGLTDGGTVPVRATWQLIAV